MSKTVYLSLGSNLGDREKNLLKAIENISTMEGFEVISYSPIYVNPAVEMDKDAPGFFNMIVKGEYSYRPAELLTNIEDIEAKMGRIEKGQCKPRPIDIDIILFGNEIVAFCHHLPVQGIGRDPRQDLQGFRLPRQAVCHNGLAQRLGP